VPDWLLPTIALMALIIVVITEARVYRTINENRKLPCLHPHLHYICGYGFGETTYQVCCHCGAVITTIVDTGRRRMGQCGAFVVYISARDRNRRASAPAPIQAPMDESKSRQSATTE
jgi:hypothetical protein